MPIELSTFFTDSVNAALVGSVSAGSVTFAVTAFFNHRSERKTDQAIEDKAHLLLVSLQIQVERLQEVSRGRIESTLSTLFTFTSSIEQGVLLSKNPHYLNFYLTVRSNIVNMQLNPHQVTDEIWSNFCERSTGLDRYIQTQIDRKTGKTA